MDDTLEPQYRGIVSEIEQLVALARAALPGEPIPCFGHMRVQTESGTRDMLLGWRTVVEGPVTILHWQTSPIASVFFSTGEGDPYEIKVAERTLEGTLVARNLLAFNDGHLVEVVGGDVVLSRERNGPWRAAPLVQRALIRPRDSLRRKAPSPFTVEALDPVQRRAVSLRPDRPMLIIGEAGCGKTTVALHRLAALHKSAEEDGRKFRSLVLVPSEGLRRLSETLLVRYGAADAEVRSYDRWAAVQARRVFPGIPRRESKSSPPAVMRLKRHGALREAIRIVARETRRTANTTREDLLHLFGDRPLLERVAAASSAAVTSHTVTQAIDHTRMQFSNTTEQAFGHVEEERLQTVDGLLIDAGTPMEDAGTIDVEDYAVLFALASDRATAKHPAPTPARYDCIVLDEAQEFAPLELELIGSALARGGTLIVAGDEGQQVDPTACFNGWPATMRELRADSHERVHLEVSYRCPPEVTTLARAVLDANSPRALEASDWDQGSISAYRAPTEFHLVVRLCDDLRELRLRDPEAMAAVICRTPEAARRFSLLLARGIELHLAEDGDFRFAPGVEVACVQEVKGLEFDYVVVPDAGGSAYPSEGEARRALYVAVTRASYQLVLASPTSWSPILTRSG